MANRRKEFNVQGADLWYLVGLITSDGCLSKDGRHVDITSKDYQYLFAIQTKLNLSNKIGRKHNGNRKEAFHIQISNRNFYDFLLSVGLTQNKSLTLDSLNVPRPCFNDFLRGLIDGGCFGLQRKILLADNCRSSKKSRHTCRTVNF